jgi:transcription elongation factor
MTIVAPSPIDALEDRDHLRRARRIQVARRLVREHDARTHDESARDRNTLLLASGELVGSAGRAPARPTAARASSARSSRSRGRTPAYTSGSSTFLNAVDRGSRLNAWKTNPIRSPRIRARRVS